MFQYRSDVSYNNEYCLNQTSTDTEGQQNYIQLCFVGKQARKNKP